MRDSGRGPTADDRTLLTTTVGEGPAIVPSSCSPRTSRCNPVSNSKRGERGGITPGRKRVVAQLLVVLEVEAAVDDGEPGESPGHGEHVLQCGGAQLRPPLGFGEAREDPQPWKKHFAAVAQDWAEYRSGWSPGT